MKGSVIKVGKVLCYIAGAAVFASSLAGIVMADQPTAQSADKAVSASKAAPAAKAPVKSAAKPGVAKTGASAPSKEFGSPEGKAQSPYDVKGFRDLTFGSSESQVRDVLKTRFHVAEADVKRVENPGEGTVVLSAPIKNVDPGPGDATVYAIMGHETKKLIQVNLVWAASENTPQMRDSYGAAAMRFGQYFDGFDWPQGTAKMQMAGQNALVVFGGNDGGTGSVRVLVDGVEYDSLVNGETKRSESPKNPPVLQIIYVGDRVNPDVIRIANNSF